MDKTKLVTIYLETAIQVELSLDASLESYEPTRIISADLILPGGSVYFIPEQVSQHLTRHHLSTIGTMAEREMKKEVETAYFLSALNDIR